ncbi:MAG: hypothetical protein JSR73_09430 [Proteobacteria bacterium]|nr:hypothetical protein [Pseudomonadota bacterium]
MRRVLKREVLGDNLVRTVAIAMDAAPGSREDDEAHSAALDYVRDCSDEQAQALQDALDRRAGARDRRARDSDREAAFAHSRDGDPDHRRDFDPPAADGPDDRGARDAFSRAADQIRGRAVDSRRGIAADWARARAAVTLPSIDELFRIGATQQ